MARKHKMRIETLQGYQVIKLGPMEIWDGSDLALLRETLSRLIDRERVARVGVDMSFVKFVPSGFFGMLFDWSEHGATICLDDPCDRVRQMIWFRQFLEPVSETRFRLETEPVQLVTMGIGEESDWGALDEADQETDQLVTASAGSGPALGL